MKTIGLLGGMSWESTALYYRLINEETRKRLGKLHSAKIAMVSVDFQSIEEMQAADDWANAGKALAEAAQQIEAAGADFLLICTNTMHKVADDIEAAIDIPLLHLADATAKRIREAGLDTVGLLGTRFTMEHNFYKGRLEQHGIEVLTPDKASREMVHQVIYDELCLGVIKEESRAAYLEIMNELTARGAQAIVEGCTEIGILVNEKHTDLRLFDTTSIHAEQAVAMALTTLPSSL